jgi:hypothetical protein
VAIELPEIVQKIVLQSDADSTAAKLKAKLDELSRSMDQTGKSADDASAKLDKTRRVTDDYGNEVEVTTSKTEKARKVVDDYGNEVDTAGKKTETAKTKVRDLGGEMDKTGTKVETMGRRAKTAGEEIERGGTKARKSRDDHETLRNTMDGLIDKFQVASAGAQFFQGALGLLKFPTLISAIGPAVSAVEALGGAVVALGSAIAPVVGVAGAAATGITALATAFGAVTIGMKGVPEAFKAAEKGGKEFQAALDKLAPSAADFVKNALAFKPVLDDIRRNTQQALFSGMTDTLVKLSSLVPTVNGMLSSMAGVIGQVIGRLVDRVTTPQWLADLKFLGEQNLPIITALGEILGNLIDTFRNVAVSASPMTQQLAQLAVQGSAFVASAAEAGRETGRMSSFFERALGVAEQLGRILANLVVSIVNVGSAAKPSGDSLLGQFEAATRKFRDFTASFEGQNQIREFFERGREPVQEMVGLVKDLAGVFAGLGDSTTLTDIIKVLRAEVVPVIDQVVHSVGPDFLQSIIQIGVTLAQIFGQLAGSSGPLETFVQLLAGFTSIIKTLIDNIPGFSQLVGLVTVLSVAGKAFATAGFVTGLSSVGSAIKGIATATVGVPAILGGVVEKLAVLPGVTAAAAEGTGALTLSLGPLGIALGALGLLVGGVLLSNFLSYQRRKEEVKKLTQEYTAAVKDENGALTDNVAAVSRQSLATDQLARGLALVGRSANDFATAIAGNFTQFKAATGQVQANIDAVNASMRELSKQQATAGGSALVDLDHQIASLIAKREDLGRLKTTLEENREALTKTGEAFFKASISSDATAQSILLTAVASQQGAGAADSLRGAMADNVVTANELAKGNFDLGLTLTSAKNAALEASQTTDLLTRTQARSIEATLEQEGVMTVFAGTTQDAARAISDAAVAHGDLTRAQVDAIYALNTNKDGTVDYKGVVDEATAAVSRNAQAERDRQDALNASRNAILEAANADLAAENAKQRAIEINLRATAVLGDNTKTQAEQAQAVRDAAAASQDAAAKVAERTIKEQEAAGATLDATAKNHLYSAALRDQAQGAIPEVAAKLNALADQIDAIPNEKTTTVTAETADAERRLANLKAIYDEIRDKRVVIETVGVDLTQGAAGMIMQGEMVKMASGGRRAGSGSNPGFVTTTKMVLIGEGSAFHPEYVIPTDPQYHDRALNLYNMLGRALGAVDENADRATTAATATVDLQPVNVATPRTSNGEPTVVDQRRIRNGPGIAIENAHFHDAVDYELLLARTDAAIAAGGL